MSPEPRPESPAPEPRVVIARGARAAEAHLLGELERLHERARADWSLLASPVRVVVPSRSLRDHLAAQLVRRLGGGVVGVAIHTLHGLAHEVLRQTGEGARGGQTLLPVLVRRLAEREPALEEALAGFDDGYGVAVASVNDLLDAGLDAANAESALECVAAVGAPLPAAVVQRATALVRVAEGVRRELGSRGLEPRAGLFRRAREALEAVPERLPTRALFIHGWADVTGVQLDLIECLVRAFGGRVLLDHPADPAREPEAEGPGPRWTERLRLRLGGPVQMLDEQQTRGPDGREKRGPDGREERGPDGQATATAFEGLEAPGPHAEARAVALRIRVLLDGGMPPESVGIVLRDPGPYRPALGAQLGKLGVPFSGSVASLGPAGRRVRALLDLLEQGGGCPADRWLDAQRTRREGTAELRLAFHGIGVGRLQDVATLDLDRLLGARTHYPLRVRRGVRAARESGDESGEGQGELEGDAEPRLERRTVSRKLLARAAARAARLLDKIARVDAPAPLGRRLRSLRALLAALGWRPDAEDAAATGVYGALADLDAELGSGTELSSDEFRLLLRRSLAEVGSQPLGGRGAGVALLSVVEARGRCFERLFAMGLNRDVFPRTTREDPLLPDALRRGLEAVLPDIPVKQRAEEEEPYLFAALLSAAPSVTISWLSMSDDGKERTASPLVEALGSRLPRTRVGPPLACPDALRPALEHALRAGIANDRAAAERAFAIALGSEPLARARREVAEKLDVGGWAERLGPFFGFVGAARRGDLRNRSLPITRLEGMAWCAWRTFLERVLYLEPPPDALAELPDATPLLVGNVVHDVLEKLVAAAGARVHVTLEEASACEPVRVVWPGPAELEARVLEAAERAARDEGIVQPGFARLLARRASGVLARVHQLEFANGGPAVLAAEVEGHIEVVRSEGEPRRVSFRADRADRSGDGVVLVDYKTGRPLSEAKRADTRMRHLLAEIERGKRLQGPAYARAAREGRYLFAKPETEEAYARVSMAHDDAAVQQAFEAAACELLDAFERGVFPPKLIGANRQGLARACGSCDVSEACLQGETGSRRHLAAWLARHDAAPERLDAAGRTAHALLVRTAEKG